LVNLQLLHALAINMLKTVDIQPPNQSQLCTEWARRDSRAVVGPHGGEPAFQRSDIVFLTCFSEGPELSGLQNRNEHGYTVTLIT
jgi:hypothetical protein